MERVDSRTKKLAAACRKPSKKRAFLVRAKKAGEEKFLSLRLASQLLARGRTHADQWQVRLLGGSAAGDIHDVGLDGHVRLHKQDQSPERSRSRQIIALRWCVRPNGNVFELKDSILVGGDSIIAGENHGFTRG